MALRRSARLTAAETKGDAIGPQNGSMAPPPTKNIRKRAASDSQTAQPSTPNKRRVAKAAPPPPATPTPSAVKLIAEPRTPKSAAKKGEKKQATPRVANPLATNAPLLSPETSRIIAPKQVGQVSRDKLTTSTANLLDEACAHLIKVDARMRPLVEQHRCDLFAPEGLAETIDPFEALASGIISQQVSGAAARAIKGRFVDLFELAADDNKKKRAPFPHPSQVVRVPVDRLRSAGLSQRKAEYLVGLAEKFTTGELSADLLADAPYEDMMARLTAVRGIGTWSAEMFACFALKRMDVFSLGDLGVQRGCAAFVGRDVAKLKNKGGKWKYMSEEDMVALSDRFRPYRSLFMWYMWRAEDTDVSTLE